MSKRKLYIDIMKIFSILAVISIHETSVFAHNANLFIGKDHLWWISFIINSVTRWAVPLFFMVSGALLLNPSKKFSMQHHVKKMVSQLFVPFIVISIFYYLYNINFDSSRLSLFVLIRQIINGSIFYHLWFVYIILGLYLFVPVLRSYIEGASRRNILYFIVVGLTLSSGMSLLSKFGQLNIWYSISGMTGNIFIFVLGYYLDTIILNRKWFKIIVLLGIGGLALSIWGTYYLNSRYVDQYFYNSWSIAQILVTIAVFLSIKYLTQGKKYEKSNFILISMSNSVYYMYLLHPFVLIALNRLNHMKNNQIIFMMIVIFLTFIISFAISFMIKRQIDILTRLIFRRKE